MLLRQWRISWSNIVLALGSLLISPVIARYNQSDRSHIMLRICSEDCSSSSDVLQSIISGSMLSPSANRLGIVGARTIDGCRYERAVMLHATRRM
jgi:hypothetical protein